MRAFVVFCADDINRILMVIKPVLLAVNFTAVNFCDRAPHEPSSFYSLRASGSEHETPAAVSLVPVTVCVTRDSPRLTATYCEVL